jgi:hypothetical protein
MIFLRALVMLGVLAVFHLPAATATNDAAQAEIEGREIVAQLLSAKPEKNFTNRATLRIFANKRTQEIPVEFHTFVTASNWHTLYFTTGSNTEQAFLVAHVDGKPNQYRVGRNTKDLSAIQMENAYVPFAGSDFWLADLGLEFLHWPDQKVHTKDIKQGKLVWVLTSKNPYPSGAYSRVVSWINPESGGIFEAEAYDKKGELLKSFEPKSVEKINGQYQPKELQIRNRQTRSRTRIEFNFE